MFFPLLFHEEPFVIIRGGRINIYIYIIFSSFFFYSIKENPTKYTTPLWSFPNAKD